MSTSLHAAVVGEVVVIARGETGFMIPARELGALRYLLEKLARSAAGERTYERAEPDAPAMRAPAAPPSAPADVEPVAVPGLAAGATIPLRARGAGPAPAAPLAARARTLRRGRVWEGVKNHLADCREAQPFDVLLQMVEDRGLTERDPEHALRIALGKKVATGELLRNRQGSYALPEPAATHPVDPQPAPPAAPALPGPPPLRQSPPAESPKLEKRRHRPGELWKHMKAHMADYPHGRTLAELVVAAAAGKWTTAQDPEHAVKICLSRVGDKIERLEGGRFRLTGLRPPAEPTRPSGVRIRRRREKDEGATEEIKAAPAPDATPAPEVAPDPAAPAETVAEAAAAPEEPAETVAESAEPGSPAGSDGQGDGAPFDASRHYPTPRSRQPR